MPLGSVRVYIERGSHAPDDTGSLDVVGEGAVLVGGRAGSTGGFAYLNPRPLPCYPTLSQLARKNGLPVDDQDVVPGSERLMGGL